MIFYINILNKYGFKGLLLKKTIVNRLYLEGDKDITFKEKLIVLFAFLMYPIYFLIFSKKHKTKSLILRAGVLSEGEYKMRRYFVNKYTNSNEDYDVIDGKYVLYKQLTLIKLFKVFKIWIKFLFVIISCFTIKKDKNSFKSILLVFNVLSSLVLVSNKELKNIYVFQIFDVRNYLPTILTSYDVKVKFHLITSSSNIYAWNRYTYSPLSVMIYCSDFQKYEIQSYIDKGWIIVKDSILWGLEEAIDYDKVNKQKASYKIGLYSSGEWARREGVFRVNDIDLIKKGAFIENENYTKFKSIVNVLIKNINEGNGLLKVYLHPYEKILYKEHGIIPPFISILDKYCKDKYVVDYEGSSSISKIYECELGVSLLSTIISDRWHLGLDAVMFSNEHTKHLAENAGEYGKYIFKEINELELYLINKDL